MRKTSLATLLVLLTLVACGPSQKTVDLQKQSKTQFGLLPDVAPGAENDSADKVALGKKLYFETKLSLNDSQSCNSCHNINGKAGGVDNLPTSPGVKGQNGDRNSPTTLNAGLHFVQFWDGRAASLKDQAKGPILNPVEMAMPSADEVVKKLKADPEYPELFAKAFGGNDSLTYDNLAEAIAAFERTLVTKDRLNDFIAGDHKALSEEEQKGLETFISAGCTACHNGVAIGGKSFQKLGSVNPYPTEDLGRFNVTKKPEDKYLFKVPSLRNVAITGPYFHDGKVKSLEEAVKLMGYHQLGKELSNEEITSIVKFLGTLTDKNRI